MATPTRLLTAEEFFELPEPPEGGKMELVDGEVVCMAPAGGEHGGVAVRLGSAFDWYVRKNNLGRVGVEIGYRLRGSIRTGSDAPDVSFVRADRLPEGRLPRTFLEGPPTLAVEVVSPNDVDADVAGRVEEYLAAGAERAWVVRPVQRTITVHWPNGDAHTYRSADVLGSGDAAFSIDGFELAVDDVFA
ncbi:MAG: Uma2 family endonuclease [Dehalococcoidia bacterium]|nr:Uma2 family endonuclease [Dehalococcoidia bacterium]